MIVEDRALNRLLAGLKADLTPEILSGLEDPDVFEVLLNPDGKLWHDGVRGLQCVGEVNKVNAYIPQT